RRAERTRGVWQHHAQRLRVHELPVGFLRVALRAMLDEPRLVTIDRVLEAQSREQFVLHELAVRLAADLLDDHAEEEVPRVVIEPPVARLEIERLATTQ